MYQRKYGAFSGNFIPAQLWTARSKKENSMGPWNRLALPAGIGIRNRNGESFQYFKDRSRRGLSMEGISRELEFEILWRSRASNAPVMPWTFRNTRFIESAKQRYSRMHTSRRRPKTQCLSTVQTTNSLFGHGVRLFDGDMNNNEGVWANRVALYLFPSTCKLYLQAFDRCCYGANNSNYSSQ